MQQQGNSRTFLITGGAGFIGSAVGRWWRHRQRPTTQLSQSTMDTTPTESTAQPGEWVAYDEDLLERARTQWQFGDLLQVAG